MAKKFLGFIWEQNNPTFPKLKDKALKEMRFIMNGINDGTLAHNQEVWHEPMFWANKDKTICSRNGTQGYCGSSHCFAGWGEILGKKAEKEKKSFFKVATRGVSKFLEKMMPKKRKHNEWIVGIPTTDSSISSYANVYCQQRWGLNYNEMTALFAASNTKKQLNKAIELFEAGYRIVRHYY